MQSMPIQRLTTCSAAYISTGVYGFVAMPGSAERQAVLQSFASSKLDRPSVHGNLAQQRLHRELKAEAPVKQL